MLFHRHLLTRNDEMGKTHSRIMKLGGIVALLSSLVSLSIVAFAIYVLICLLRHFGVDITPWN